MATSEEGEKINNGNVVAITTLHFLQNLQKGQKI
jgi:hypothetical protein